MTALFVGTLLLLFYIGKRPWALLVTSIVGAFAWPVVSVSGAVLLLFLETGLPIDAIRPAATGLISPDSRWLWEKWLICLAGSLAGLLIVIGVQAAAQKNGVANDASVLDLLQGLLTGLPSDLALIFALVTLAGSSFFFKAVIANLLTIRKKLFFMAVAAIVLPRSIVWYISNPALANPNGFADFTNILFFPPQGKVLLPLVTIASFWGPIVILLLLKWDEFCVEIRKLGPGVVAVIALSLLLALPTEPRFVTSAWPFFMLGTVLLMEKVNVRPSFNYVYATLVFLYSQFWMKINLAPWTGRDSEGLLEFPKQLLFMHYGLWMNWWSYLLQLAAIGLSLLAVKNLISNHPQPTAAE